MRKIIGWTLFAAITLTGVPAFAASTSDFYLTLLKRGISDVDAGRYDTAITPLRLAAFGLIESIEHYETAQTYLTIAFDKVGRQDQASEAAHRLVAAERVERRFASLTLPQATRSAFEAAAKKVLTAADVAALNAPPKPATGTNPPPATIVPKPAATTAATTTTAAPATQKPAADPPATKPAASTASNTKPVVPPPATATTTTAPATKPSNPPAPKPATPTNTNTAASTKPATTTPATSTPAPVQPRVDVNARLAAGDRALLAANLTDARRAYKDVLDAPGVDHATYIRVGEGFYRARDFANALTAFTRAGGFRSGEEAYHYYAAVAAYETGDFERARRELAAALPYIEVTTDVQQYRTKIESAR